jgi:ribonuclease HI
MYFDGSVMKEGAVVGLVFISPLGVRMEYLVRLHFPASNNAAEYKALIDSLRIAVELGIKHLEIRGDSELVVDQVMKDKNCVDLKMAAYCQDVRDLEGKFHSSSFITCCTTTIKQPTYSQRSPPVVAWCCTGSLRVINTHHLYEQRERSHLKRRNPRSWRSISRRN